MKENLIIWLCGKQRNDVVEELEGTLLELGLDVEKADSLPEGSGELVYFYTGEASPRDTFSRVFKIFFAGGEGSGEDAEAAIEADLDLEQSVRKAVITLEKLGWIPKTGAEEYSDDEEEEVKQRLEDLGYL